MNHIKKKWNKVLSAVLALAILLSCIPVQPILAADEIEFKCAAIDDTGTINLVREGIPQNPVTTEISIADWVEAQNFSEDGTVSVAWEVSQDGIITVTPNESDTKKATIQAVKNGTTEVECTVTYTVEQTDETIPDDGTETQNGEEDQTPEAGTKVTTTYTGKIPVTVKQEAVQTTLMIKAPEAPVKYPDKVKFEAVSAPGFDVTEQVIKWEIDGEAVADNDGKSEIEVSLKPGKHTVKAYVDVRTDAENSNIVLYKEASVVLADYEVAKGTPVLDITATPGNSTVYPGEVTFNVTPDPKDSGYTDKDVEFTVKQVIDENTKKTITEDSKNNPIKLGGKCVLPVGKYEVTASVTGNDYYEDWTKTITYTVGKGTPVLEFKATKDGTEESVNTKKVEYPTAVTFKAEISPSLEETQQTLSLTDNSGNPVMDREGTIVTPGTTAWILPAGNYTVKAAVAENSSYNGVESTISYEVTNGTPRWSMDVGSDQIYVGQAMTINFPIPTNHKADAVQGIYKLDLVNLTGDAEVVPGNQVTLTAGAAGAETRLIATFIPEDENYKSEQKEFTYTVNKIPVDVTWNAVEKTYDGIAEYRSAASVDNGAKPIISLAARAANFEGKPEIDELPEFTNTEYVFALQNDNGEAVNGVGTWTGKIAKENLILSDSDAAVFEINEVAPISVKINPIVLTIDNVDLTGVVATGKTYDATSVAKFASEVPKFKNNNNILEAEFASLRLAYEAHYYDNNDNLVYGNPDEDITASKVKFSNVKIMQNDTEATNYTFVSDFVIPDFTGEFTIEANDGLNEFAELGLQDEVVDTFENIGTVAVHWVNADGQAVLQKDSFSFSENIGTATEPRWNWSESYTLQEGLPRRIYAKHIDGEGNVTISSGAYVVLDTVAPTGQIWAKVGNGEAVSIAKLSERFETIAKGEGAQIIFEGSDASSKIAKIECYGTNIAWEQNTSDEWKKITPTYTFDVNNVDEKEIEQILQNVESGNDLKSFYYARITDYAGNISYVSSSGVLLDVTVPTATVKLEETAKTFEEKNVYEGDVNFTVALEDHNISSGIKSVSAVLLKNGTKIAEYDTKEGNIWKASDNLNAINELLDNDSPTDSDIKNTIKEDMSIEGTLTGLTEANGYTLQIVAVDKVGHESAISEVNFAIDKEAPVIKIDDHRIFNTQDGYNHDNYYFTGGYMTVTISDYTLTTPVAELVKELDDAEAHWNKTVVATDGLVTQEITFQFGEGKYYSTEGQYEFKVAAQDSMGRESTDKCDEFTLDYTAPTYEVVYSDVAVDSQKEKTLDGKDILYYNKDIEAKFTINEATSYDESKVCIYVKNKNGDVVMSWEDGKGYPDNDPNYVITHTEQDEDIEKSKEFVFTIKAEIVAEDDGYTYEISGMDCTGNILVHGSNEAKKNLEDVRALDVTAPQLTDVAYTADGKDVTRLFNTVISEDGKVVRDYINVPTTMTFTITEHNPTRSEYTITQAEQNVSAPIWQQKVENGNKVADIYTSVIKVPMMGKLGDEQEITYTVIDKAGNELVLADGANLRSEANTSLTKNGMFTDKFTVDTVKPIIKYEYEGYNPDRSGVEGIDYFKQNVKVKVTVNEHNFNGLDTKVVLFNDTKKAKDGTETTTEGNGVSSVTETEWKSKGNVHTKVFTLKGDDLYNITISGSDCAKNALVLTKVDEVSVKQDQKATKLSVAIDRNLPIINDSAKPSVVISSASSTTASGNNEGQPLFGGDVTFKVTVYDPNALKYSSGIHKVVFEVEADNGASSEVLIAKAGTGASHNGVNVTLANPEKANLLGRGKGNVLEYNVTISSGVYNSNNIQLKVTVEDIAKNQTEVEADPISIDITPPETTITYDNNEVSNLTYFHDVRTATVQVRERNFSNDCITFTVNGSSVPLNFTQTSAGSGNGDNAIWQATYSFEKDDDYVVKADCKDRINNVGIVKFDGQAPEEFTVDKTLPIIEIEFDNNNSFNENYYDAQRTATVVITERNFNPDEVEIIGDGTDAGTSVAYPTLSGWSTSGDVHRATLHYSQDGLYTLDVQYTDLATNEAEDIPEEEFTIDNTDPEIIISGVEEMMPYSGEVRPEISFSDNNYDSHTITMTRTERENIGVDVTEVIVGSVGVSIDGTGKGIGSRILEDVEHLEENDGIYTLTVNVVDKAGRSTEEMITYSVNRFGSVYVYSQDLADMLQGYYREVEGDLYITAYNANQLVEDSTKLEITCDGSVVENQKSTADLASVRQASNGGWFEYKFTLDHDDFRKDGGYEIALSDKDEAGNTRTNSDAPVSFYIDATAPMIDSIIGLEESIVNADEHQISYAISDAIALESIVVYVNDEQVSKVTDFENNTAYEGSVTLGSGMRQSVRIVAHDKAGNMVDTAAESFVPAYAFSPEITVSTSFFVRLRANTTALWCSIAAVTAVLGGVMTAVVVRVRKKNKIVEED